jgi:hypothetical protein
MLNNKDINFLLYNNPLTPKDIYLKLSNTYKTSK